MRTFHPAARRHRFMAPLALATLLFAAEPVTAQFAQPAPQPAAVPAAQPGAVPYAPAAAPQFQFQSRESIIVGKATEVLRAFSGLTMRQIPPAMLSDAEAVVVVPELIKAGFIIGGRHGRGVLLVRDQNRQWSNPLFLTLTGGSIGWQAGVQSSDIVLVFKSHKGLDSMLRGEAFTLGADAGVAIGPVGRRAEAATNARLGAEIYSYSRSRGLFAGVSVEGSEVRIDVAGSAAFYGLPIGSPDTILRGSYERTPEVAVQLRNMLTQAAAPPQAVQPGQVVPDGQAPPLVPINPPPAGTPAVVPGPAPGQ
ncbi:MAG: lipid-binding SYLF domain-containing protein [Pirellulales bacterium]